MDITGNPPIEWFRGLMATFSRLSLHDKIEFLLTVPNHLTIYIIPEAVAFHLASDLMDESLAPLVEIAEHQLPEHCEYFGHYWFNVIEQCDLLLRTAVSVLAR
jgi:hypothetical protein